MSKNEILFEEAICEKCQKIFLRQKPKKTRFCGISCRNTRTWSKEKKELFSVKAKEFYNTEAGELNRWVRKQRNTPQGFKSVSDPIIQEKVNDDYIIPYNFDPDTSVFNLDGDIWITDESGEW